MKDRGILTFYIDRDYSSAVTNQ